MGTPSITTVFKGLLMGLLLSTMVACNGAKNSGEPGPLEPTAPLEPPPKAGEIGSAAVVPDTNLIQNFNFEAGSTGWNPYASGFAIDASGGRGGSKAIKLVNPGSGSYGASQPVAFNQTTAKPIYFCGYSKAQSVSGSPDINYSVYLDIGYTDGTFLFGQTLKFAVGTHDWQFLEATLQPAKPVAWVRYYTLLRPSHSGTVWFDDVCLKEVGLTNPTPPPSPPAPPPPPSGISNLVQNPGFENDTANWGSYVSGYSIDPSGGRGGSKALKLVNNNNGQFGAGQQITLNQTTANTIYFCGYSRAQGVAGLVGSDYSIYLDVGYTDGTFLFGQTLKFALGSHDWQFLEATFQPTKPVAWVRYYLLLRGSNTGTVWFDDVCLSQGTSTNPPAPPPPPPGPPAPPPPPAGNAALTLLKSYFVLQNQGGPLMPYYENMVYRPRQFRSGNSLPTTPEFKSSSGRFTGVPDIQVFNSGAYQGWDVLLTPNYGGPRSNNATDWLRITLNRPARVAVVWRGWKGEPTPGWLSGWSGGGTVAVSNGFTDLNPQPVYVKDLPAGQHILGGPKGQTVGNSYLVLFAEQGGSPSGEPALPSGISERPQPNQTCPEWVHDQYRAFGPDNQYYRTWHPQIDPVYWCYFHHDHGSDPELLAPGLMGGLDSFKVGRPLYDYVNKRADAGANLPPGLVEPHVGNKNYVFERDGRRWMIVHHFGSSALGRACRQHHSMGLAVAQGSEVLADLRFMGDFGPGQDSNTDAFITGCPTNQASIVSGGARKLKVAPQLGGYEPWRSAVPGGVLGFRNPSLTIDTADPIVGCSSLSCTSPVTIGAARDSDLTLPNSGAKRIFSFEPGLGIIAINSGVFYTDPYGKALRTAGAADAIRQYVKGGLNLSVSNVANAECYTWDAWRMLYSQCQPDSPAPFMNLEGQLNRMVVSRSWGNGN